MTFLDINFTDLIQRLVSLEKAVAKLQRDAAATTPQAREATDEELAAIWVKSPRSTNESLRAIYNLGRKHGAPAPAPEPAPPSESPERSDELLLRLMKLQETDPDHARFRGLLVTADWLRCEGFDNAATHMERRCGLASEPNPVPEPTCEPTPDSPPANCTERLLAEGKPCNQNVCTACGPGAPRWEACRRALAQELPAPTGSLLDQVTAAIAKAHANRFPDEQYRSDAQWAVRAVARWLSDERWDGTAAVVQSEVERG